MYNMPKEKYTLTMAQPIPITNIIDVNIQMIVKRIQSCSIFNPEIVSPNKNIRAFSDCLSPLSSQEEIVSGTKGRYHGNSSSDSLLDVSVNELPGKIDSYKRPRFYQCTSLKFPHCVNT